LDKTNNNRPLFILAGNGSYQNRGCEAIVRGTIKIVEQYFKNPQFVAISCLRNNTLLKNQQRIDSEIGVTHKKINLAYRRFELVWFIETFLRIANPSLLKSFRFAQMIPYLKNATAILSLGGDTYSLDYGIPHTYLQLDEIAIKSRVPIFIWGASIGPFSVKSEFEHYMTNHLKSINGIMARESSTVNYLNSIGVKKNVFAVADPAFAMVPTKPALPINFEIGMIGLNLSPLMAKYCCTNDIEIWANKAADIVNLIISTFHKKVLLIYHETNENTDDYQFLEKVIKKISDYNSVQLLPPGLSASELKWVISQCCIFAGARTHSTIAALSSCVPTLSFAYSMKARGINTDIFGSTEFCIEPEQLNEKNVVEKIGEILNKQDYLRSYLKKKIPKVIENAYSAGYFIQNYLSNKVN
jgi:colanic acid/amylovoran biosynthesis protein